MLAETKDGLISTPSLLDSALDYARRGYPVLPCHPSPAGTNSKLPLVSRDKRPDGSPIIGTGGLYKATTDEATIRQWWTKWPKALIGVRMGRDAGLFAVDPDVPKRPGDADGLAAWGELVARHGGAPFTHAHLTPSGGRHVLFRYPEDRKVTNAEGALPKGINVRGEGGYIIAPPSRLLDGREYQFEEPEHAFTFADPPTWLLDLITAPEQKAKPNASAPSGPPEESFSRGYVASAVEAECSAVASTPRTGRNNRLNEAAFNLGTLVGAHALDASEATYRLLASAATAGLISDKGEARARATIESGLTAGAEKPRQPPKARKPRSGAAKRSRAERAEDGPEEAEDDDGLPAVFVVAGKVPRAVDATEKAFIAAGTPIYTRAGALVRPVSETVPAAGGRMTTVAKFRTMCPASLADHSARVMRFRRYDKRSEDWVDMNPPGEVMAALLAREGEWRLPPVAGLITTPTLRSDGSILSSPGYDPATRLYLALDPDFRLPAVPERPTREDAERALQLLDGLIAGFPFVGDVDRSVALSGIMTAVVRGVIPTAPLHAIRAHSPGTGKSFLVDIASTIATGRRCPVIAAGKTEEETEKRLGALLKDAVPVISIDNVNGDLGGDMLCQLTERPLVRVRILGKSEAPELECRSAVFATGNNLTLVGDMTRRAVICTLDTGLERPELREFDFDPMERVLADRGAYVAAVMTIARAYRAACFPKVCGPIGSYGEWSASVRAPLVWLGCADPVESMETAREEDPELSAIRELFEHWQANLIPNSPYTINGIVQVACDKTSDFGNMQTSDFRAPEFRDLLIRMAGMGGAVNSKNLGMWFKRISGRVVNGLKLETRPDAKRGNKYFLRTETRPSFAAPTNRTEF